MKQIIFALVALILCVFLAVFAKSFTTADENTKDMYLGLTIAVSVLAGIFICLSIISCYHDGCNNNNDNCCECDCDCGSGGGYSSNISTEQNALYTQQRSDDDARNWARIQQENYQSTCRMVDDLERQRLANIPYFS